MAGRVEGCGELDPAARLAQVHYADGTVAEGAPAWTPPPRPRVRVIANLREDPLVVCSRVVRSIARNLWPDEVIDAWDVVAWKSNLRSVDLERAPINGARPAEPLRARQETTASRDWFDEAIV